MALGTDLDVDWPETFRDCPDVFNSVNEWIFSSFKSLAVVPTCN